MSTNIDKKWSIHELKKINLQGENDVTNFYFTLLYFFVVILVIIQISPFYNHIPIPDFLVNFHNKNFDAFLNFCMQHYSIILYIEIFFAVIALIKLTFNRNFILYDMLYKWLLHIKLITIEDNLSPFEKLITEFEKIILGINKNHNKKKKNIDLKDKILFFWIRKDKDKSRERSIEQLVPFLSLIVILFALKEKSYRLVVAIGAYYAIIGILYVAFITYIIQILKIWHYDIATLSIVTMFLFIVWYILTIYNAFKLVDIDKYIKTINNSARRAVQKEDFNFKNSYSTILQVFDRDNAIYIYDNRIDKYQQVNSDFLRTNLNLSKKYIDRSIGTLITAIISILLVVFVEISANGIFGTVDTNSTKDYSKIILQGADCETLNKH